MGIETAAIIALSIAAASTAYSIEQSNKAAKAQKNVQETQAAQQKAVDLANRRQQLREERVRRAQIEQASAAMGATGSSGESGAISSLGAQVGANISNINMGANAASGITEQLGRVSTAQRNMQIAQGVSSLAGTVFQGTGGFGTIFGSNTPKINPPPTTNSTPIGGIKTS